MPRIDVKAERVGDGCVISAHTKDWDLMQSFPHAVAQDIVDGLVKRWLQEHGDVIMQLIQDDELVVVALSKEIEFRLRRYLADRKKLTQKG